MSNFTKTIEAGRRCLAYRQITDASAAIGCPMPHGGAVMFQAEQQDIRYRLDGEDPTDTVGFLATAGDCIWFVGDLSKVRFIEVAASAVINVHVFE